MSEIIASDNTVIAKLIRAEIVRRLSGWRQSYLPLHIVVAPRPSAEGTYAFTVVPMCLITGVDCGVPEHAAAHAIDADGEDCQQLQGRVWLTPQREDSGDAVLVYAFEPQRICPSGLTQNSNGSTGSAWTPDQEPRVLWLRRESANAVA